MSNRNYNVFFNTHTVSGIVISIALYIIFFAGAFSIFKDEIAIWEEGTSVSYSQRKDVDFDAIIEKIDKKYDLTGRDVQINFGENKDKLTIFLDVSKDSLALEKNNKTHFFEVDIHTLETKTYSEYYSLGEFLYRLHFLHQLPGVGIYLAGFVALFFLFAIVTGVIVHWKKIIPDFYKFNPKIALKRVWADAHTVLGVLGLPFQFIFAVTGAYFCLGLLVLIPANILYNGDQDKLLEDLRPDRKTYEWLEKSNENVPSFNRFAQKSGKYWNNFHLTRGYIRNYKGENMKYLLMGELKDSERFIGIGYLVFDAYTGKVEVEKKPNNIEYTEDLQRLLGRLHFADFGGVTLKIIYFVLALVTCFVIITGVLIWIEARNKKSMSLKQRLYTAKVGHIYLAICLSMLPVTALSFLFVKITHGNYNNKQMAIYAFYFIVWLIAILFFRYKRNNYLTNKCSLLLGAIFGFIIPIANGVISNNWLWNTYKYKQFDILFIDMLWLTLALISLFIYFKITPEVKDKSSFNKTPIDYKTVKDVLIIDSQNNKSDNKQNTYITTSKNQTIIPMRTKIIILWTFIVVGFIFHHIYGLATVFFKESVFIEGSTNETPFWAHQWRILMEGLALLFAILTVQISKKWFRWLSFIWAIIVALFNIYHVIEAILYEATNYSEIFILFLMVIVSVFLVLNIYKWKNYSDNGIK